MNKYVDSFLSPFIQAITLVEYFHRYIVAAFICYFFLSRDRLQLGKRIQKSP